MNIVIQKYIAKDNSMFFSDVQRIYLRYHHKSITQGLATHISLDFIKKNIGKETELTN